MKPDPTQRFSNRVENYVKYRPTYPAELIATLSEACRFTPAALVADIGSGTGLLTELFLRNGNQVFAVEPNLEMRHAGEQLLQHYANFHSVAATAEASTLSDHSVDFVVAGQAFHWFDRQQARREFIRILRPSGWVMLIWNERETRATPFLQAYERLLEQYATDYAEVDHRQVDEVVLKDFYGRNGFTRKTFRNIQRFDFAGLQGRLLSSSYTPEPDHPNYAPMLAGLARIFQLHEVQGQVEFEYTTQMYYGKLSEKE